MYCDDDLRLRTEMLAKVRWGLFSPTSDYQGETKEVVVMGD